MPILRPRFKMLVPRVFSSAAIVALIGAIIGAIGVATAAEPIDLTLRHREPIASGATQFHILQRTEQWNPEETAIVVCDMWDLHHCLNAVRREGEMAPRMNDALKAARKLGVTIIHSPSSCMDFYQDHPARKRAQAIPKAKELPEDIGQWCYSIPSEEQGDYPIDQSDGGEDDDLAEHEKWAKELAAKGLNPRAPWTRQIDVLEIDEERDFISDNGIEIWSLMESRGIKNVMLMGVHTNMCVLGRPFGLRQMAKNKKRVVLVRDLTDTMYNPKMRPFVSHFTGTDLIVEHIEKWVCPTITSDQLMVGTKQPSYREPFRYRNDKRPHVVILIGEREYQTNETLPPFAISQLGKKYRVTVLHAKADDRNSVPGISAVKDADVLLVSMRRRVLPHEQLKFVRQHVRQGKPVVGIRTANHAFTLRNEEGEGDMWPEWDAEVIGGSYTGHHGAGPRVAISVADGLKRDHPLLNGVDIQQLHGFGSLYKVSPLRKNTQAVLIGSIPEKPAEPIAWTHTTSTGSRVFYTSLGHVKDFEQPAFQRFLRNAIDWAAN